MAGRGKEWSRLQGLVNHLFREVSVAKCGIQSVRVLCPSASRGLAWPAWNVGTATFCCLLVIRHMICLSLEERSVERYREDRCLRQLDRLGEGSPTIWLTFASVPSSFAPSFVCANHPTYLVQCLYCCTTMLLH